MSAAATAAGYLYASGRLRGRSSKEQGEAAETPPSAPAAKRRPIRVAAIPETPPPSGPAPRAKPAPRIEYRTRRWRPDE